MVFVEIYTRPAKNPVRENQKDDIIVLYKHEIVQTIVLDHVPVQRDVSMIDVPFMIFPIIDDEIYESLFLPKELFTECPKDMLFFEENIPEWYYTSNDLITYDVMKLVEQTKSSKSLTDHIKFQGFKIVENIFEQKKWYNHFYKNMLRNVSVISGQEKYFETIKCQLIFFDDYITFLPNNFSS